ncbi:tyrosine-protein phosphatase [Methylosinus sp. Sm6]|uniref:tyrosine-protein phosphatase n=1 Tax=Methylosinus sp. Sm6 TaxID=2866948 RepID=UPI001C993269|nr:CpsB/CapC family capsule biosynthesis tyrosine phosphatase [Methylosinus sp. Sm6]MBY6242786.1 capsular biosynthesis protein [Methylosinus sp. Sm6]
MIDLHSHFLPGVDDGAADLATALDMARMAVADGVTIQACTPHILPGLYHNTGPEIRLAIRALQDQLDQNDIPLTLVSGADVHLAPDLVEGLRSGRVLSIADTRYVLVEPPHHVAPLRLVESFFSLLLAGYVPVLTHPERLSWIGSHYASIEKLYQSGVLMQLTAGSLVGAFGRAPRYWAERMLDEGRAHILASDAHGVGRRRPNLGQGFEAAAQRVGEEEAALLVLGRPRMILANEPPSRLPAPSRAAVAAANAHARSTRTFGGGHGPHAATGDGGDGDGWRDFLGRVRAIFR